MKTLRWIIFLPAFFITEVVSGLTCRNIFEWIYAKILPLDNLVDWMLLGWWLPWVGFLAIIYGSVLYSVTRICPHQRVGAWACLVLYVCVSTSGIITSYNLKAFTTEGIIYTVLFCTAALSGLLISAFTGTGSFVKPMTDDKVLDIPEDNTPVMKYTDAERQRIIDESGKKILAHIKRTAAEEEQKSKQ